MDSCAPVVNSLIGQRLGRSDRVDSSCTGVSPDVSVSQIERVSIDKRRFGDAINGRATKWLRNSANQKALCRFDAECLMF